MKQILGFALVVVVLLALLCPAYAFDRGEHDEYLEKVLFILGEVPEGGKDKMEMLESASYLTLDQYNGKGADDLDYLRSQGVSSLPKSISDIDFTGNSLHRRYTHQGWDYTYSGEKDKANWPARKDILRSTTNKVFDFGVTNEIAGRYCDQCDSFSALVYYVHILGDQIHDNAPKGSSEQLPLARAHADENTPDIFYELRPHLETLFSDITGSRANTYNGLMTKLDVLARKARSLDATTGGINTDEKVAQLNAYETELMDLLISYVPRLLRHTEFFKNAFYN